MPDEAAFRLLVRDALAHLYEPAYLAVHPLSGLLKDAGMVQSASGIPAFLTAAIDELRPLESAPRVSTSWRRHRYLRERYVEGATHRHIANRLQISTRQASREHEAGLEALERLLWARYSSAAEHPGPALPPTTTSDLPRGHGTSSPEDELLHLGATPPEELTSLDEVTRGALATVSRLAAERGLSIRSEIGAELPTVTVDRLALRHILLNLLGYAIESVGRGVLAVTTRVDGETVDLAIEAEAEPAPAQKIGESREDQPSLAAARRMAETQGLHVDVGMSLGGRLKTTLSIPAARATTILLVDDSPDIGRLFRRYLSGTDYCLIHARSAEKALQLVREIGPAAILLDILLPRDDGWQFLESLRADPSVPDVRVIVCSIVPEQSLARSLGVVEFLAKPVSQRDLLSALARWCPLEASGEHPGTPSRSAQARQP